jgi:hypothetical protein
MRGAFGAGPLGGLIERAARRVKAVRAAEYKSPSVLGLIQM